MAWRRSWLSTLRGVGHPTATQDSLPGAGQALLGGLGYPQGFSERFRVVAYISSPFPKLAWRKPLFPPLLTRKTVYNVIRRKEQAA